MSLYRLLDSLYLGMDRKKVRRTRNIQHIPAAGDRRGGKHAYAEWAHVIGIFQTLMALNLVKKTDNNILDVGCGTGLLGIASQPFIGQGGHYTGLDVMRKDIEFCARHYPAEQYDFVHFDVDNPAYNPGKATQKQAWPLPSSHFDLVTALSVWTHLNEADALFYLGEVSRVLIPGGKAIISFFVLDEVYQGSLKKRSKVLGGFHAKSQEKWIFDQASYGSDAWFHPVWADIPESAIGVTDRGIERLLEVSGLTLLARHRGNWKEIPGVYFQDVLIFSKP